MRRIFNLIGLRGKYNVLFSEVPFQNHPYVQERGGGTDLPGRTEKLVDWFLVTSALGKRTLR